MPCASARAPSTACGEQQLRSPSVAGSAQSSSVTATTSSPASSASWAAAALSTPPLIATSVRRELGAQPRGAVLGGRAERAVERVGRQRRRRGAWRAIRPPSASATSSGVTSRGVEEGRALDELHHGAAGGRARRRSPRRRSPPRRCGRPPRAPRCARGRRRRRRRPRRCGASDSARPGRGRVQMFGERPH